MLNKMRYPVKPNCEIPAYKKKIRTRVGVFGGLELSKLSESKFAGHHLSPVNQDKN